MFGRLKCAIGYHRVSRRSIFRFRTGGVGGRCRRCNIALSRNEAGQWEPDHLPHRD